MVSGRVINKEIISNMEKIHQEYSSIYEDLVKQINREIAVNTLQSLKENIAKLIVR